MDSEHPLLAAVLQVLWGRGGYMTQGHLPNQDSNHMTTSTKMLPLFGAGTGDSGESEPNLPELSHSATTSAMVVWLAPSIRCYIPHMPVP